MKNEKSKNKDSVYIILGPSGCGKGTQGKLLAEVLGIPFISMGDLFREEYEARTPEGLQAYKWWGKGMWAPDNLTVKVFKKKLDRVPSGFILDSFPRTPEQVPLLDVYLRKRSQKIDKVFHLKTSEKEAVWRIRKRISEDREKGKARGDETEEAIKKRLVEYQEKVRPLLELYRKRGLIVDINNESRDINLIHKDILSKVEK